MKNTDILDVATANGAADDIAGSAVGGAATLTVLAGTLYELILQIAPNPSGGGDKERYFKWAVRNNHATETSPSLQVHLASITAPAEVLLAIGVEDSAGDSTVQGTAPVGVVFTPQTDDIADAVLLGPIPPSTAIGVWGRMTVQEDAILDDVLALLTTTQVLS